MRPAADTRRDLEAAARRHLRDHHRAALLASLAARLDQAPPAGHHPQAGLLGALDQHALVAALPLDHRTTTPAASVLLAHDPEIVAELIATLSLAVGAGVEVTVTDDAVVAASTATPVDDDELRPLAAELLERACSAIGLDFDGEAIRFARVVERRTDERAPLRVLVVEDNPTNQILATKQLERLGAEAVIAGTGELGLERADLEVFPLILMDWNLPDIDGLEVTRRIRAGSGASKDAPIVAMTANAMAGDRETCLAAGMNDFLAKPVRMEALGDVLTTWADRDDRDDSVDPERYGDRLLTDLGGADVAGAVIRSFLDELDTRVSAIIDLHGEERRRAAHTLKSTAALLVLDDMASVCADIEYERISPDPVRLRELADEASSLLRLTLGRLGD